MAFCYPIVLPRYFKMEVEMTTPNNYSQYDFTNLTTASSVMDSFAETIVSTDVRRFGAVVRRPNEQLQATAFFSTIYVFNGTQADVDALVNAAQSCLDLGGTSGCSSCEWNLCETFNSTAPSSNLLQFGISTVPTSLFNVKPSNVSESITVPIEMLLSHLRTTFVGPAVVPGRAVFARHKAS